MVRQLKIAELTACIYTKKVACHIVKMPGSFQGNYLSSGFKTVLVDSW